MTVEVLEYVAKVGEMLTKAPEGDNMRVGEVAVLHYDERIGVFKDIDGWWEYFPGQ